MVFERGNSVCGSSFFLGVETTQVNASASSLDTRNPSPVSPVNPFYSASVVAFLSRIKSVLTRSAGTQILFSVIKAIAVLVVYVWTRPVVEYEAMDLNDSRFIMAIREMPDALNVIRMRGFVPMSKPVVLHKAFVIVAIDDGILPLCERNKFDRLILRLDDCMSVHAVLHGLTSNEIVMSGRNCTPKLCAA